MEAVTYLDGTPVVPGHVKLSGHDEVRWTGNEIAGHGIS
jgi:hypothetical protein